MKKELPKEVKQFFADMGRKGGKKLFEERGSQYFKDLAAKRKRPFGKPRKVTSEAS